MSYYSLPRRGNLKTRRYVTTTMAEKGMNLRDLPQFLSLSQAINIENYLSEAKGKLVKRKGLNRLFETAGTSKITMLKKYTDDIYFFCYDKILKAYTISTATVATIKNDFTTSDPFSGVKYGDYFFICNGGDKIGRISQTLNYDAQSSNFTVGHIVTGGTSGATAVILEDSDSGATGILTLGNISGIFQDNEALSDEGVGDGTANGVVGFTFTSISAAPKAKILAVIGTRLYAGNLTNEDPSLVRGSQQDDGTTNPPFTGWTVGTGATAAQDLRFGNGGAVQAIGVLGSQTVVFGEDGKFAFRTTIIDSAGTLSQDNPVDFYRIDMGGARAVLYTPKGLFYVNEGGLWQMVSTGATNVPYSSNEINLIPKLLGRDYFDDVTLTDVDLVFDEKRNLILCTVAKDSSVNNLVIVYDIERKTFSKITGWNISRFMKDGGKIYGAGGKTFTSNTKIRVWECFDSDEDDGADIWCEYEQEINTGAYFSRKNMNNQYFQGKLSVSSDITVSFDIYDREGKKHLNKKKISWTTSGGENGYSEFGSSEFGKSAFGGSGDKGGLIESFAGFSAKIANFQRLILRLSENSKSPHEINWISLGFSKEIPIRRRNLSLTT